MSKRTKIRIATATAIGILAGVGGSGILNDGPRHLASGILQDGPHHTAVLASGVIIDGPGR